MARKLPKERKIKRKAASLSPKKKILIICEGKNTEPDYIKKFSADKKHNLVECKTINGVGTPQTIVNKAIEEKRGLVKYAKKSGNSFDELYEIWCMSDRDEHPRLPEEMQRARDNGLEYVLSNPCFELWGYLHYAQNDAPTHRHDMQKKLSEVMNGYDHKHGTRFNYEDMNANGSYESAVQRSKELIKRRIEEDNPNGDPSTNIHDLLNSIEKVDDK